MSREALQAMMAEMADDVTNASLAEAAVTKAGQVRRRRRAMVGAAAAVLVLSATLAVVRVADNPPQVAGPSPVGLTTTGLSPTAPATTAPGSVRIDRLPESIGQDPAATGPYWPATFDVSGAPTLTDEPLSHATMLYAPYVEGGPSVVYAYGEGEVNGGSGDGTFRWVRLDVELVHTRDDNGNLAMPLDVGSLGPLGLRAAFAQPDELVIFNLVTGDVSRIPLAGLNEEVTWLANGRHVMVGSDSATWLVDTRSGLATKVAANGWDVAPLVGGGTGLTTVDVPEDGPASVRTFDDAGQVERDRKTIDLSGAPGYRLDYLAPHGSRYGNSVAIAGIGSISATTGGDFLAVVDSTSGRVTQILELGAGRSKGCCAVVGWLGPTQVLVHVDQVGLLTWTLETGAVRRINKPGYLGFSVAQNGCDWQLTINGETSTCIT